MKIRGILRDDIKTRARLVEKPAEQLELLVHVLLHQGSEVALIWDRGRIEGDPALTAYVHACARSMKKVPVAPEGRLVHVSLSDADSIVALLREVLESHTVEVEAGEEEDEEIESLSAEG